MNKFLLFLAVLTLDPGPVLGSSKPNKFEKEINFLVNHMSGEVVVSRDKNSELVKVFMERLNQRTQIGPIRLVDFDKKNQIKCEECKWIVMIQESAAKVIFARNCYTQANVMRANVIRENLGEPKF
jgi:hypothetical protein